MEFPTGLIKRTSKFRSDKQRPRERRLTVTRRQAAREKKHASHTADPKLHLVPMSKIVNVPERQFVHGKNLSGQLLSRLEKLVFVHSLHSPENRVAFVKMPGRLQKKTVQARPGILEIAPPGQGRLPFDALPMHVVTGRRGDALDVGVRFELFRPMNVAIAHL